MKTAIALSISLLAVGALLPPEPQPTLCHWEMEAALNGGNVKKGTIYRCYRVAVRKINERAERGY